MTSNQHAQHKPSDGHSEAVLRTDSEAVNP